MVSYELHRNFSISFACLPSPFVMTNSAHHVSTIAFLLMQSPSICCCCKDRTDASWPIENQTSTAAAWHNNMQVYTAAGFRGPACPVLSTDTLVLTLIACHQHLGRVSLPRWVFSALHMAMGRLINIVCLSALWTAFMHDNYTMNIMFRQWGRVGEIQTTIFNIFYFLFSFNL